MPPGSVYPQEYIKQCFDVWYLAGRPNAPADIRAIIPVYDRIGKKPSTQIIRRWMIDGAWDAWADDLDARAMVIVDNELVNKKAELLRKHLKDAAEIATKALEHLKVNGFDSSSSAVHAYFKSTEEQRKTLGFSDLLERLDKMTSNDVENEIIALLNRAADNDQIIESDAVDMGEDDSETESPE